MSVAALIERIGARWLAQERERNREADAKQARLQGVAARTLGAIHGGDTDRSTSVRQAVHARRNRIVRVRCGARAHRIGLSPPLPPQ